MTKMPANMERDLFSQASDFIYEQFGDRLTEGDRNTLEHWMTSQLEAERKGWKSSMQRSLKEVEKERKRTIETNKTIEKINEKVYEWMGTLRLTRAKSGYQSSDRDYRLLNLSYLEENMESILSKIKFIYDEHVKCFDILKTDEDAGESLSNLVSKTVVKLEQGTTLEGRNYKEQVFKLNRDIEHLVQKLEHCENELQTKNKVHLKEIDALTQIITRQRDNIENLKSIEKSEKSTQTNIVFGYSVGIQVTSRPGSEVSSGFDRKSTASPKMHYPIQSITITTSKDVGERGKKHWTKHSEEFAKGTSSANSGPIKYVEWDQDENKSTRSQKLSGSADSLNTLAKKQTIDSLRGQVVEFAEKLEFARGEVERYQKQLAWMKTTPYAYLLQQEIANIRKAYTNEKYQDGFLSGARKDILAADFRDADIGNAMVLRAQIRANSRRFPGLPAPGKNVNRCLRCHKVFNLRDNHRKSCRFHPQGKKKIEKYDSNGKIETVTYLWQCCLQGSDVLGCTTGEHV